MRPLIERFCPDEMHKSLFDIDLDKLWRRGIRGIILDVDNTLVHWGEWSVSEQVRNWITQAKERGFRLCIASNGIPKRVEALAQGIDVPAITRAVKPRKKAFHNALALLGTTAEETAVIGDQVFTDVFGGNRVDMYTILINPSSQREMRHTQLIRKVERRVLRRLVKKGYLTKHQIKSRFSPHKVHHEDHQGN